ncbi:hypothetical protein OTSUT76_0606 [Orientia tsutsugamushi str. UT76]|nr:hypothetical protein OTSUT76_0606 [Orientia tsutsugamushi str. UT76]
MNEIISTKKITEIISSKLHQILQEFVKSIEQYS